MDQQPAQEVIDQAISERLDALVTIGVLQRIEEDRKTLFLRKPRTEAQRNWFSNRAMERRFEAVYDAYKEQRHQ